MVTRVDISEVSFLQKGKGKDLLFLHGYLSSKEAFTAQIEYFSKFYRVTAVDFLGFGGSAPLSTAFSVADYAAWMNAVMSLLDVQKPHVIAHSFGCRVAVKMASEREDIFDKILLTGPAGVVLNHNLAYYCKVWSYRFMRKIAPRFAERHFGSEEYRRLSPLMKESYKKIVNEDLRNDAKKIKNQVLIVEGMQDKTTPLKEAQAYLECFACGRLVQIEGGHFAFAQSPVAFTMTAEEFFYE